MRGAYRIVFIAALAATPAYAEDAPPLTASLQCDRAPEPGRVRCTVEARAVAGRTLQWADVVLVELPNFTQALKGRLAPSDSIARDATSERWAFGLVAKKAGEGDARIRVRAVVCEGDRCASVTIDARATVKVG
jgi:hypothetical protein